MMQNPEENLDLTLAKAFGSVVGGFVEPDQAYALLDFPDHPNIGDSAIYAGEIAFLDQHARRPASYVCSFDTYREDVETFCPEGPLLLHGGGNFGSIWRKHQKFRHEIIGRYRHRRIIQLAQSVHFATDDIMLEDSKRIIGQHSDFIMLVRDKPSYDFMVAEFDCQVLLCPDAAHCLQHLPTSGQAKHEILSIMRNDKETGGNIYTDFLGKIGPIKDWGRQPFARSITDRIFEAGLRPRFPKSRSLMQRREKMYRRQASYRVLHGTRLLSKGGTIVSDRLHAHLIASLMGKPHVCLDNNYGKIARYIAAWGKNDQTIQCDSLPGLQNALRALGHSF